MLYSILIYTPEDVVDRMTPEQDAVHVAQHLKLHEELRAQGKLGPVVRLMSTRTARQLRTAQNLVVDGPFAETKEQLLGFYIVDCETQEEAVETARLLACEKRNGTLEVRPVTWFDPGTSLK